MRPSDQLLAIADQCLPTDPERKAQLVAESGSRAALVLEPLSRQIPATLSVSDEAWEDLRESLARTLLWALRFGLDAAWLDRVTTLWSEAQRQMLERLDADRARIEEDFGLDAGRLVAIRSELSHRHHQGRSVSALDFASGLRLIYKPRSVAIEYWYASLVEQLNEARPPVRFSAPRVLDCGFYGWAEFLGHRPCRDRDETLRFYRNAGGLLCLLHLLQATDMHYDNLVARGPEAAIVDAETLLQPSLRGAPASILQSGMIPSPGPGDSDFSALGFVHPRGFSFPVESHRGAPVLQLLPEANLPFANRADAAPELFAAEQVEGFRLAWEWLSAHRGLLREHLERARDLPVRYVVRDTQVYYLALVRALFEGNPALARLPDFFGDRSAFGALLPEEEAALAGLDLPRFTLHAADRTLGAAGAVFALSGYEAARAAIEGMDEDQLARHLSTLEAAWRFYAASRRLLCTLHR